VKEQKFDELKNWFADYKGYFRDASVTSEMIDKARSGLYINGISQEYGLAIQAFEQKDFRGAFKRFQSFLEDYDAEYWIWNNHLQVEKWELYRYAGKSGFEYAKANDLKDRMCLSVNYFNNAIEGINSKLTSESDKVERDTLLANNESIAESVNNINDDYSYLYSEECQKRVGASVADLD
jgi:hypothetical protein